ATFDACIRYLGEDPWDRIREFKKAMPNTPQQMLFRGQNILGYRHYADDLVEKFVERAAFNGVDVFRVFDAMNDMRNLECAIAAVRTQQKHAQGTISFTVSPVYTLNSWLDMSRRIEDMGADSLCIKDMAGLLRPYVAYDLVSKLKESLSIPIHMQCHATTGLSTATYLKAIEAGIDNVDTAISSMSMTYGHSPTETLVAILEGTDRDTGLDIGLLEEIAGYFREVRIKYAEFEGSLRGIDSRILVAQVPGGMLTNLENQLKEQNAVNRIDEVLEEIPRVREDLGFIPLVTPTSQIVGTQAVLNVLAGERYKNITKETEGVLRGEYGAPPADVNLELQKKVLGDGDVVTCRPADLLSPEFDAQRAELLVLADEQNFIVDNEIDDTLTYALFPQVGLKFLKNRGNSEAFEPRPGLGESGQAADQLPDSGIYTVEVEGTAYSVKVTDEDEMRWRELSEPEVRAHVASPPIVKVTDVPAPLTGTVYKILVKKDDVINEGDVIVVLEAMKMETEIRSPFAGKVENIYVNNGDMINVGETLIDLIY
ncbi:MAG: sodium-extruding oxaloacetate decarboxylase subunit alpha, partial [Gammaproteobacteria bacterium]|nr:sodium-extruding oxaloacetate decarboxylase subunit alpha [Gammaproteobacteria bacterium]